LKPTATKARPSIPQLYANSYTQTLSYTHNTYDDDTVSESRDRGKAAKTVYFTYEFDKHTFNNPGNDPDDAYYPTTGYGYSFPTTYYGSVTANKLNSPEENYENKIKLGMFYINSQWNMYTWAWQSNAVRGLGKLEITIKVIKADNSEDSEATETFTAGGYWIGGYWSEKAWSTKSIYSYINFDNLDSTNKSKLINLGFEEDGSIIISKNGKLLIKRIIFNVTAIAEADSTGANNCIGDVWVSNLYHQNSNTTNKQIGYGDGSLSGTFQNTTIKYYKPSRYLTNNPGTGNYIYVFAKDGLYVDTTGNGNYIHYDFKSTGIEPV
jgi:hypothetical protein